MLRNLQPRLWLAGFFCVFFACCDVTLAANLPAEDPASSRALLTTFFESFNHTTPPFTPAGWLKGGSGWATSGEAPSSGSGGNNLLHVGSKKGWIQTPPIDLSGVSEGNLSYLARRSSTYPTNGLAVLASIDGGVTFPFVILSGSAALPAGDGKWESIEAALPAQVLNQASVIIRFEGTGGDTDRATLRIDDVRIGYSPLEVTPTQLSFSAPAGGVQTLPVSLKNTGSRALDFYAPDLKDEPFAIEPDDAFTLSPGQSRVFDISFKPIAPGVYSGTATFTEKGGNSVKVYLSGKTAEENRFGFARDTVTVREGGEIAGIPLSIAFSQATGIQGIEFTVRWEDGPVELVGVERGPAIENHILWTLSHTVEGREARFVLLCHTVEGMPKGRYDPVVTLQVKSDVIAPADRAEVVFTIESLSGALADPRSGDARLVLDNTSTRLIVLPSPGVFSAQTEQIFFTSTPVGSTAYRELTVENQGGVRALNVSGVGSTNPLFDVEPETAVIPHGGKQAFRVGFTPSFDDFGLQSGNLEFVHNGLDGSPRLISFMGIGVGGRGDIEADGIVDVFDLVTLIDLVLGKRSVEPEDWKRADQHPWGEGNGRLDIHDLTVFAQAIVRGEWPDGKTLPPEDENLLASATSTPKKQHPDAAARIHVGLSNTPGGYVLQVPDRSSIRALEQLLQSSQTLDPTTFPDGGSASDSGPLVHVNPEKGIVRVLFYRADGETLEAGNYPLGAFSCQSEAPCALLPFYTVAVSGRDERVPVIVEEQVTTGREEALPPEVGFDVGLPFPHPVVVSSGQGVRLPVTIPSPGRLVLEVFDLLGRRIVTVEDRGPDVGTHVLHWDGKDASGQNVRPGLYLLRVKMNGLERSRTVVVL